MRDGVMGEGRSEHAIRPLQAIEQFATTSCTYLRGVARERLDRHTAWGRFRT